jgi:hypothetical protein
LKDVLGSIACSASQELDCKTKDEKKKVVLGAKIVACMSRETSKGMTPGPFVWAQSNRNADGNRRVTVFEKDIIHVQGLKLAQTKCSDILSTKRDAENDEDYSCPLEAYTSDLRIPITLSTVWDLNKARLLLNCEEALLLALLTLDTGKREELHEELQVLHGRFKLGLESEVGFKRRLLYREMAGIDVSNYETIATASEVKPWSYVRIIQKQPARMLHVGMSLPAEYCPKIDTTSNEMCLASLMPFEEFRSVDTYMSVAVLRCDPEYYDFDCAPIKQDWDMELKYMGDGVDAEL